MPFWALMVFMFVVFIAPQTLFPALAPFRLGLLTIGLAIAAHLFDTFHRRPMRLSPEIWILACLVAWAIVTAPLSYRPGNSVSFLFGDYLRSVAIFWILSDVVTVPRLRLIAWALTLMAIPIAATALYNFISRNLRPGDTTRILGYGAQMTENPNGVALVVTLILPFSLALFLIARTTRVRAALFAVIALDVTAVVVTWSRGGFLALAAVMVTYLYRLLRRPERAWAIATLVLLLVCVPFVPSGYVDRLATIGDIQSDPTGSAQDRWSDTLAATRWVLANPIVGAGIGQHVFALNEERGPTWALVHNVYLIYAADLGIPGLLLFILLLVRCFNNAWLVQRRSAHVTALRDLFYLAEAIQTSLVAFALSAFFYTHAYDLFYFYYFAGLAVAVRALYNAEARNLVGTGRVGSRMDLVKQDIGGAPDGAGAA